MPPKQQVKQSKPYLSVRRSWPVVAVTATLAGVLSWFIFNKSVDAILTNNADRTMEGLLVGFLVAAAFMQVVMVISVLASCALAWLALWLFRVPKSGQIVLCSSLTLAVAAFLEVQYASSREMYVGSVIVVFILTFGLWTWVFLSLRRPAKTP